MENKKVNEEEIKLIQSVFSENENLLKSIRALFFGLDITQAEKDAITGLFTNGELKKIFYKRFLPTIDKDAPIGQTQDVWLGAEQMIFGQSKDTIAQAMRYKSSSIQATRKALALLDNPNGEKPSLDFDEDDLQIGLLARNQFIRHIESQLTFIWLIASQKGETMNEMIEKASRNSAK